MLGGSWGLRNCFKNGDNWACHMAYKSYEYTYYEVPLTLQVGIEYLNSMSPFMGSQGPLLFAMGLQGARPWHILQCVDLACVVYIVCSPRYVPKMKGERYVHTL